MPKETLNGIAVISEMDSSDPGSRRAELMEEIVSENPGFLIRRGNYLFLTIFILICFAAWFVRYPTIISTTAKLTSINAPKPIVTRIDGKLVKLNISENQYVKKGHILAFVESTASHQEVLVLSSKLDSIQVLLNGKQADQIKRYFTGMSLQLGELQSPYQEFSQAFLSFNSYLANGFYLKKMAILQRDKDNLIRLYNNLIAQKELQEQDLALTQKTFSANELLQKDKVISDFDYRLEQSKLINKKLTVPQIKSLIINNENLQAEKEKEIIELDNTIQQQRLIFQQALNTFRSKIDEWEIKYILRSPIDGKVAFASFLQENQQLQTNEVICFINPENSQYFAEVMIPQANFGKVALGQKVLLKFQSYPFQEYGSVQGNIAFVSHIPSDSGYLAKVSLTNGLMTNHMKSIQYRDGLLANAEIITKDMRLLERIYYSVYGSFVKQN